MEEDKSILEATIEGIAFAIMMILVALFLVLVG